MFRVWLRKEMFGQTIKSLHALFVNVFIYTFWNRQWYQTSGQVKHIKCNIGYLYLLTFIMTVRIGLFLCTFPLKKV